MRRPAILLLLALAACGRDPFRTAEKTLADGRALAQLQPQLDRERQCAPLLDGRLPLNEYQDGAVPPGTAALIEAGLIERDPVQPAEDEPGGNVRYRPTAASKPWLRLWPADRDRQLVYLCIGRRRITKLALQPRRLKTDPLPILTYRFRLVDAPPWAQTPGMKAAFPFLRNVYSREFEARDLVMFIKDAWSVESPDDYLVGIDPSDQTFYSCTAQPGNPPGPCHRTEE